MDHGLLIKFSFWLLIASLQMRGYGGCLEKERIALLELKAFFKSASDFGTESILTSWDEDKGSDCCGWDQVKCNATTGRVMELLLNSTRNFRSFSRGDRFPILNFSLFHPFEELRNLDLYGNRFTGQNDTKAYYHGFGSLKQLKILNLGSNNFNDNLLPYLTTITSLTTLNLEDNYMEGFTPNQGYDNLSSLKQLKILNLGYNNFKNISPFFSTLTSLTTLNLESNEIQGFITKQGLANLINLKTLSLCYNDISGSLAALGLQNLRNLEVLDVSYNQITGSLVDQGLGNLINLKILNLSSNSISSSPTALGLLNLRNLEVLDISGNKINGSLGNQGLQNLRNLKALDVGYNEINGSLGDQGICKLKNLIELHISSNKINGHLPRCLSNLSNLKALDLSSNELSGILPSVVANLTYLEYLDLSRNSFRGSFLFSSLSNLSKLEIFKLSAENNMLGLESENWLPTYQLKFLSLRNLNLQSIPDFLLHQRNLQFIDLSHNKLAGTFPIWLLQNNSKLEEISLMNNSFTGIIDLPDSKHGLLHLDISINNFSGQLPENLGKVLPKLKVLRMSKNSFEGNIPSSMGEMKRLEFLDLSSNKFSGEIPRNFFTGCLSLTFLNLSDNNFYGQIFPRFMNLTQLRWLYFDNNHFSGKIEDGLGKSTVLQVLDISNNKLSDEIPLWIGNFSYLQVLLMSKNVLQGNIPIQLSNLERLEFLDISENKLSGTMPSSFNLSSLQYLYMQKNAISGIIPDVLFESTNLVIVDMSDNEFSGSISHWINKLSNLHVLLLRGNHLQSDNLEQLCQLRNLRILNLSYNKLNGSIPSCLTNILSWTVRDGIGYGFPFQYRNVYISGSVSSFGTHYIFTLTLGLFNDIYAVVNEQSEVKFTTKYRYESYMGNILQIMTGVDLSGNCLTGNIPPEVGYLKSIHSLNLSHNFLSGSIPDSFSHLEAIESLDLSYNNLSGQIPVQLGELNFMGTFNVSYNNFSGPIPNTGQLGSFDDRTYIGNPNLCGPPSNKSCTSVPTLSSLPSNGEKDDQSAIDMMAFYGSFAAAYVTILLALAMILWINSNWRRQWFCFIDACINSCLYWLLKHLYYR